MYMPPKKKQKTIGRILFSDPVSLHSDGSEKAAEEIREILASVAPSGQYPSNPSLRINVSFGKYSFNNSLASSKF